MNSLIVWTPAEMIAAACAYWSGDFTAAASDCKVVETTLRGRTVYEVLHTPTGRRSSEIGAAGCWHPSGTPVSG